MIWLAFLIFVPLVLTSNTFSVRAMGRNWCVMQRFVYVAAVATLLHWIFIHNQIGGALVHFLPLAGFEVYRFWKNQTKALSSSG
jgi:methionine sulfoxide reductase heme-binding subunit